MAVFNTPKPENMNAKLNSLVNTSNKRRMTMRYLMENEDTTTPLELDKTTSSQAEAAKKLTEKISKSDVGPKKTEPTEKAEKAIDKLTENTKRKRLHHELAALEAKMYDENRKSLFNMVIFEMAYNANWIDESVKESMQDSMLETFNKVIETLELNGISVDMESDVTPFIKLVHEAVDKACGDACKRIATDAKTGSVDLMSADYAKQVEFDLTDKEADNLEDNLSDLGKEDLEKLVKDKVLTVVRDEKQKSEEKTKDLDEIQTTIKDESGEGEGTEAELAEGSDATEPPDDTTDTDEDDKDTAAKESFNALVQRSRNNKNFRKVGTSLFECMLMSNAHSIQEDAATMESYVSDSKVMNAAMMETVTVYTIMETLNTLKLCNFDNITTRKLSDFYRNTLR